MAGIRCTSLEVGPEDCFLQRNGAVQRRFGDRVTYQKHPPGTRELELNAYIIGPRPRNITTV